MHFSNVQLFWECCENRACENYPAGLPDWAGPHWFEDSTYLKQHLHRLKSKPCTSVEKSGDRPMSHGDLGPKDGLYFSWAAFRIRYSQCALTKEEDKLVAIQGISQQLGQVLNDKLIAGLWRNRILEELCWFKIFSENITPCRSWRAPTWSWASNNARIWVSNTTKYHNRCKNKQIWCELEDVDVKAKASGELEKASLRIRCRPIPATLDFGVSSVLIFRNSMPSVISDPDFQINKDNFYFKETLCVHVIIIQRCPHLDNTGYVGDCAEGLMLKAQHGSNDIFERVGLFTADNGPAVDKIVKEHEAAETRVITLV
jgi:hypothetical protein